MLAGLKLCLGVSLVVVVRFVLSHIVMSIGISHFFVPAVLHWVLHWVPFQPRNTSSSRKLCGRPGLSIDVTMSLVIASACAAVVYSSSFEKMKSSSNITNLYSLVPYGFGQTPIKFWPQGLL